MELELKVNDIVEYTPFGGGTRRVRVTAVHADVKNGRPGFEGTVAVTGDPVWGYLAQVTRHVSM